MLRTLGPVAVALVALAACAQDGAGTDDALAERLRAVLAEEGTAAGVSAADLDGADLACPDVRDPAAGDRATCVVRVDGGRRELQVDLEFDDGGSFAVIRVTDP